MRVLIDANVYLSFLLNPVGESAATKVVVSIGLGWFDLLFPPETEGEIRRNAETKQYLRQRIGASQVDELIDALRNVAIPVEEKSVSLFASRDPDDTYLLERAIAGDADFLVTGDRDLLILSALIDRPQIVSPASFLESLSLA